MLLNITSFLSLSLIEQLDIVTVLGIVVAFFLILLIVGVRKTFKLKAENERLNNINPLQSDDDNKSYKDFTEGHLYDNN
jgi:hypothetical protein